MAALRGEHRLGAQARGRCAHGKRQVPRRGDAGQRIGPLLGDHHHGGKRADYSYRDAGRGTRGRPGCDRRH